jgi:hypothetical protein
MELGIEERKLVELLISKLALIKLSDELITPIKFFLETDGAFPAYDELKNLRIEKLNARNKSLSVIEEKEFGLESNQEFENFVFELYKCLRLYHQDKEIIKVFKSYTRHLNLTKLTDDLKEIMPKIEIKN